MGRGNKFTLLITDFIIVVLCILIVFLKVKYMRLISGGDVFCLLGSFGIYLSLNYKILRRGINVAVIILLLLTLINYVAYMERVWGLSQDILVTAFALTICISLLTSHMILKPIARQESSDEMIGLAQEIRKRVRFLAGFMILFIPFIYTVMSISVYAAILEDKPPVVPYFIFSVVVVFWLGCGLIINLRNIKIIPEEYIIAFINTREHVDYKVIEKWVVLIAIGSFLIGTFLQMSIHDLWSIWILSWGVFLLIVLNVLQTWKHVFSEKKVDVTSLDAERLPAIYNPGFILKLIVINVVVGVAYFCALVWFL